MWFLRSQTRSFLMGDKASWGELSDWEGPLDLYKTKTTEEKR